jgi:hypothetical protein
LTLTRDSPEGEKIPVRWAVFADVHGYIWQCETASRQPVTLTKH